MGKKVRKKSRGSAKEKRVATHSPKNVVESSNPSVESVDGVVSVLKEVIPCPHLENGVNLDILSSKIGSTKPTRCEDCREGAADRRGGKGKGKHGKKKSGASADSKSESKAIWVCLECGHYSCGGVGLPVTPQCHAVRHAKQTRHNLVVHKDKPQLCWCFPCKMLIAVEKNEGTDEPSLVLSDVVKLLKRRSSEQSSADVEDVWFGSGSVVSDVKSGTLSASDSYGNGGYTVRGLVNLGNTCFFNSVTQNLLAMDRLRDIFLQLDVSVGPLTSSLKKLFTETNPESGLRNVINPRSFFGAVCSKAPQFRGYQQHDSHELLRCLLDGLSSEELALRKQNDSPEKEKSSSSMTTTVDGLFGGQISSTVCCVECGHSSTVYEPFLDLSLSVPTKKPPPRKAQPASRTKKTKLPPKKGGKTRAKVNKDSDSLPVQSLSTHSSSNESTCPAQSGVSVAGELVVSSGDSTILGSEKRSNTADKDDSASPSSLAAQDSDHSNVCHNVTAETSTSLDDFSWLDYVEEGTMDYQPDLISQKKDVSMIQDAESKDEGLNEGPVQAISESSSQVSFLNQEQNARENSSGNGLEDEVPLQVQGSEILLLPYKEETSSTADMTWRDGEASSSVLGCAQNEADFDGFGDLFNEPEVVAGPAPRPSSSSDVMEAGFIAGNSSESDPDEVDDTDSPVSVETCLAHFIKPELLSNENGWHCENCLKILRHQKLEEKSLAETVSMVVTNRDETGSRDNTSNKAKSSRALVRGHGNGDIINGKVGENSISNVKICTELENGQTDEIFHKGEDWETKMKDSDNEELQSSGLHITYGQESCNGVAADSCNIQQMKTVQRRDPRLDLGNNDAEENDDEVMDSNSVKVKRDATMRVLIHKAPPVLTVHLKRFSQDARGRIIKLNGHVSFRETIDLRPYMDPRCINEEKYEYRLVGVVEHSGTMRGGHYVAYVRGGQRNIGKADKETEDSFTSTWYNASDAYVREVSLEEVLRCEAYILFYEKT